MRDLMRHWKTAWDIKRYHEETWGTHRPITPRDTPRHHEPQTKRSWDGKSIRHQEIPWDILRSYETPETPSNTNLLRTSWHHETPRDIMINHKNDIMLRYRETPWDTIMKYTATDTMQHHKILWDAKRHYEATWITNRCHEKYPTISDTKRHHETPWTLIDTEKHH